MAIELLAAQQRAPDTKHKREQKHQRRHRPPHIADPLPIRAPATASSASGSSVPTVAASDRGKPKSRTARREPVRSASFATPASANTPATTRRAINTAELTPRSVHERPTEISTPSLAPSLSSNP